MKITLSPSSAESGLDVVNHSVSLEHKSDDLNVEEAFRLFSYAMVAFGYHHKNVKDCLNKNLGEDVFGRD